MRTLLMVMVDGEGDDDAVKLMLKSARESTNTTAAVEQQIKMNEAITRIKNNDTNLMMNDI